MPTCFHYHVFIFIHLFCIEQDGLHVTDRTDNLILNMYQAWCVCSYSNLLHSTYDRWTVVFYKIKKCIQTRSDTTRLCCLKGNGEYKDHFSALQLFHSCFVPLCINLMLPLIPMCKIGIIDMLLIVTC